MNKIILLGLALLSAQLSFAQNNRHSAEVFLQIEDRGNFTVYLDNEFIGSNNGRFRFYDVENTTPTLTILQGNKRIYLRQIDAHSGERLVLSYSARLGLKINKTLNMYVNGQYVLNGFDGYLGGFNTGVVPPNRPDDAIGAFENLIGLVKKEAFDEDKIKLIQAYTVNNKLTTAQTASLLQSFMRDEYKLSLAKSLTPVIIDLQNYFTLKESFVFNSTKDEFLAYLNNRLSPRAEIRMRPTTFEQLKTSVKREVFDENKTKLIQVAAQNASPSTAQVAELLKLYTFEDKALSCAKSLYNLVSDPQRYFTIKDVFKFKSTQDTFLDFLGQN